MKFLFGVSLIFCILIIPQSAIAQCCGAGNPINLVSSNGGGANILRVGVNYQYNYSDTYFQGYKKAVLDFPMPGKLANNNYNFLSINAGYSITKRLTLSTTLGFYINKTDNLENEINGITKMRGKGLGDLDLMVSYKAYTNNSIGMELTPYINIRFPVGQFNKVKNGAKLPIALQPSSGSFKYSAGVYFFSNLPKRFFVTSTLFYEYNQRIKKELYDYKYGNLLFFQFGAFNRVTSYFNAGLQLSYEWKDRAKKGGTQKKMEGTGYQKVNLSPFISFTIKRMSTFTCIFDEPVLYYTQYSSKEDVQLVNKFGFQLKFSQAIGFKKKTAISN